MNAKSLSDRDLALSQLKQTVCSASEAAQSLTVYRGALEDPVGQAMVTLLYELAAGGSADGSAFGRCRRAYASLFNALAEEVELSYAPLVGNAWQNHLLDRILLDENPFSLKSQLAPLSEVGPALRSAVQHDLRCLRLLFDLDPESLSAYGTVSGALWPSWSGLRSLNSHAETSPRDGSRLIMKQVLASTAEWESSLPALAEYYAATGTGLFGCFRAFRWVRSSQGGCLKGVAHPDPIRLSDLIGYDRERELLLVNTEHFLAGFSANNVLLYGDRGTGKSSTIKALLNEYGDRGLRLIEVSKQHLVDLPAILEKIRWRRQRFVLYLDDLSFDDQETDYKSLKAVLEGGLESRPNNVVLYATSNRRHIVRERFGDREEIALDEVHVRDTVEEKLSLSDRFGITIIFAAPDQERYLSICSRLAERAGLMVGDETLRRRALQWSARHKGLSGRTARQFVDHLMAEVGAQRR